MPTKIPVVCEEMTVGGSRKARAPREFSIPNMANVVKVYTIEGWSKEICGGPHAANTGDLEQLQDQKGAELFRLACAGSRQSLPRQRLKDRKDKETRSRVSFLC